MQKEDNPYQARFGDAWRVKIKATAQLSKYCDVRDMIAEYLVQETLRAGKKYFYHNALSLLTAKESIDYMRENGYLAMWIRPQNKQFESRPEWKMKNYYGQPVGNSPELMQLDTSLNTDVHESVNCHNMLTNELPKNDPRRFGLFTPKDAASSYKQIFDPITGVAPKSSHIVHDIEAVINIAIPKVINKRGTVLDNDSCTGCRYKKLGLNSVKKARRGKRDPDGCNQMIMAVHWMIIIQMQELDNNSKLKKQKLCFQKQRE